ncbi:solute carrier family 20 (sodium-dependent phosphate transporter) [Angomonas deanei]|nr:solute carrier family 20 (sodium-dependent phosphate transporter) [Angomonas deanei]|eukprot:EPY32009.1 solute carrier family 20 (sodium-dependent phosphate transporter) [Angomonas deanei]
MLNPYLWMVVVSGVLCFLVACGNGANDLANAFGTSYGSRVLTLAQIVVIAACCEFAGAVALGSNVASTMSGSIADMKYFENDPYCLMYGFLCTLGCSFIWLLLATYYDMPVSSHHAVAGGIIGFALVFGGGKAVNWAGHKDDFPFVSGVVPIIISWVVSPLLAGIVSSIFYALLRFLVLERQHSQKYALYGLPVIVMCTFFLEFLFIFMIAAKSKLGWGTGHSAWMAIVVGGGAGVLSIPLIPFVKRRIKKLEVQARQFAEEEGVSVNVILLRMVVRGRGDVPLDAHLLLNGVEEDDTTKAIVVEGQAAAAPDTSRPPHDKLDGPTEAAGDVVQEDSDEGNEPFETEHYGPKKQRWGYYTLGPEGIHYYDPRSEYVFRYLQIFTAACTSLAHGSNDVSNSIGPFAAVYNIYVTMEAKKNNDVPYWLLCIGGAGIVVGLATYGLNIMRFLGEKIAIITPVRGFCAELATALVVAFATTYGIPISSTHCITGAVLGISLMDVGVCKVKWILVLQMYVAWVCTLVITGVMSATFFAQGIATPVRGF